MGSRPVQPRPPTVLVDRYEYGAAKSKYQKDLTAWESQYKEKLKKKRSQPYEPDKPTMVAEPLLQRDKPQEPVIDPSSPVFMPDPESTKRGARRAGARRSRTRGGRVSTIFTSGLGG